MDGAGSGANGTSGATVQTLVQGHQITIEPTSRHRGHALPCPRRCLRPTHRRLDDVRQPRAAASSASNHTAPPRWPLAPSSSSPVTTLAVLRQRRAALSRGAGTGQGEANPHGPIRGSCSTVGSTCKRRHRLSWGIGVGLTGPGSKLESRWMVSLQSGRRTCLGRSIVMALDRSLHGCT
jgi:hypothetical protein